MKSIKKYSFIVLLGASVLSSQTFAIESESASFTGEPKATESGSKNCTVVAMDYPVFRSDLPEIRKEVERISHMIWQTLSKKIDTQQEKIQGSFAKMMSAMRKDIEADKDPVKSGFEFLEGEIPFDILTGVIKKQIGDANNKLLTFRNNREELRKNIKILSGEKGGVDLAEESSLNAEIVESATQLQVTAWEDALREIEAVRKTRESTAFVPNTIIIQAVFNAAKKATIQELRVDGSNTLEMLDLLQTQNTIRRSRVYAADKARESTGAGAAGALRDKPGESKEESKG